MNNTEPGRWALWLSFPLATLLAVASLGGLFLPFTYKEETPVHAAQYVGNDVGNLAVIVPALLIASILARRGSVAARLDGPRFQSRVARTSHCADKMIAFMEVSIPAHRTIHPVRFSIGVEGHRDQRVSNVALSGLPNFCPF